MGERLSSFRRFAAWCAWLALIAAPLVFVRPVYDWTNSTYRAEFRADRWQMPWQEVPVWLVRHWMDFITVAALVAAGVAAARGWRRARPKLAAATPWRILDDWRTQLLGFAGVMVTLVLVCRHVGDTEIEWAVMACMYMVLAMGLNLTVGMTGLLVLGYAGFVAIGAYTFAVLHTKFGVSLWMALGPAAVIGGALGFLLGLPSIRLRGDYLAIVTLGFGETVRFLIKNIIGEQSLVIAREARVPSLMSENAAWRWLFPDGLSRLKTELWVVAVGALLSLWLVRNLMLSRIGRAWIAIREDETAAAAMGIPAVRLKLLAFTLSAVWAAVAGVFYVAHNTSANPEMFGFSESVLILSMVVLGGMGSLWGPVAGALVLYFVPELLRERFPLLLSYRPMMVGALMVAMMIYRPQGLLGTLRRKIELKAAEEESES